MIPIWLIIAITNLRGRRISHSFCDFYKQHVLLGLAKDPYELEGPILFSLSDYTFDLDEQLNLPKDEQYAQ